MMDEADAYGDHAIYSTSAPLYNQLDSSPTKDLNLYSNLDINKPVAYSPSVLISSCLIVATTFQ